MPDDTKVPPSTETATTQPGQVITPGSASASQPAPAPKPQVNPDQPKLSPAPSPPPPTDPAPPDSVATPPPSQPVPDEQPEEGQTRAKTEEQLFTPDQPEASTQASDTQLISWTASEYVEHEKNSSWYIMLALAALALAALVFLLTKDKVSAGVVIFGALSLGVYGARSPRQITYQVDGKGLTIGQKQFAYEEFKSFAIVPEGGINSIVFVHHKRFAPLTTIYLAPDQEEAIVNALSSRLPLEEHHIDAVEHLMRRIRF